MGGKPLGKRVKNSIIFGAAFCAYTIARRIPRKIGLKIFGTIGAIAFIFPNEEKNRTIKHLRMIFGGIWTDSQIKKAARGVYVQLGKNTFDGVYLSGLSKCNFELIVKSDSFDEFDEAYRQGKGIVAITAHTGCFEMLLHYFAIRGFKCFAIGRRLYDDRLEWLIRQNRSGENITYMNRTEGPRKMIRELQEGKVFGVLIDQDTDVEGVFVDFLGKNALTPSGPLKMAMKFNVPVFVVTTARQADDSHYVYINKRLSLVDTGNFEEDLKKNVQLANDQICETIRTYPTQWVWMHRRWKRQP